MVLDFESQLELGEMLLRVGRIADAETELRKAQELNKAGVFRTPDDPDRGEQLERLQTALAQADKLYDKKHKSNRLYWLLALGVMSLLLAAVFAAWVFARNRYIELESTMQVTVEAIETRQFVFDDNNRAISAERTMFVERLREDNVRLTESASVAQLGRLAATQASEAMMRSEPLIVIPQLNPSYQGDMCGSAWHEIKAEAGEIAWITLNRQIGSEGVITNEATWRPTIPQTGRYKVEAFVANHPRVNWECPTLTQIGGDTNTARYQIAHALGETLVIGDQFPMKDQYIDLGVYSFDEGDTGYIYLPDETIEPSSTRYVSFSHLRLTWVGR